jgi:cell filamentation protein
MIDSYLWEDTTVLKNKLNIKDQKQLDEAEANYTVYRLKELALNPLKGDYDLKHLLQIHQYIFQDLYFWAGQIRNIEIYKEEDVLGGMSIEYTKPDKINAEIKETLKQMVHKKWEEMDKQSIANEFCDSLARLWKIHPFREGNTRTTLTFCCQFADEKHLNISRKLFERNSIYVRTALVAYNAFFKDGNNFSKKEYLKKIVFDSIGI